MKKLQKAPTWEEIQDCHQQIQPYIHRTPVLSSQGLNDLVGAQLFFKCENFQKVGAFKMRGATAACLALSKEEQQRGLATHSSGNHAQAVALTAQLNNIPAYIVMPSNAPEVKRRATAGYGAKITLCTPTMQGRVEALEAVVAETGAHFIPPFDDYNVICGQATVAKELLEDYGQFDYVICPVGGGGLASGTALTVAAMSPETTVLGVEPFGADDAYRSMLSGRAEKNQAVNTIADGLRTDIGLKNFEILKSQEIEIIRVEDEEIKSALKLILQRLKIVIEPSCAVVLAAVLKDVDRFKGKRIGLLLSGGNLDIDSLLML